MLDHYDDTLHPDCTWAGCSRPAGDDGYCGRHRLLKAQENVEAGR